MKKVWWVILSSFVVGFVSCNNCCQQEEGVVSQRFIHKYGFDVSQDEWVKRNKEGVIVTTYDNGIVQTETFVNGVLHGPTTFSHTNSTIISRTSVFDDGTLLRTVFHDEEGIPFKEEAYEFDNKKIVTLWNKKGIPLSIEEYDDGVLTQGKYFSKENELESSVKDGNGERVKRDRNNIILCKDQFTNATLTFRTTYHSNGNIQSESSFENYYLHGKQLNYSPNGKPTSELNWKHGILDGNTIVYKNEKIIKNVPYTSGKKHGIEKEWDNQGNLLTEVHWNEDKRHGSSRFYEDDQTRIKWFFQGHAVSLQEFQAEEFREKLIADLRQNN